MILKQYYLGCLAHASYLIADRESGQAAVVDPQRDIEQYVQDAAEAGCAIHHVFLTHFHADFVAGHLELRDRTGASIHLGARARAEYPFVGMGDGDAVQLGRVRLEVLETPGHSPESISILVRDPEFSSEQPYAVLTGDTLFIGDVGRPDLRASLGWEAPELAKMLYDSLHAKLVPLPDATLVYPAHGAGSLCGRNLSPDTVSTIGAQRRENYALQPMARDRFVELIVADQPEAPPYFSYDAELNAREHATLEQALQRELNPLSRERFLELAQAGAQVLDTRDAAEFAVGHFRASVNVGLDGSYATWCGTIFDRRQPIVLVAAPGREIESATRLGRIGFDNVVGYLEGGIGALKDEPQSVARLERITATTLAERLCADAPPQVIDVRGAGEREQDWIEPSLGLPLTRLPSELNTLVGRQPLVTCCGTGYRSVIAASLLQRAGLSEVSDLIGGLAAWEAARLPIAGPGSSRRAAPV